MLSSGERIDARMKELSLTQADVMRATGAARSTVHGWINNVSQPTGERLFLLGSVLKVNPNWIISGGSDPIRDQFLARMSDTKTTDEMTQQEKDDSFMVDVYDVKFSNGNGESIEFHFESVKKSLPFEKPFFTKRRIKPEKFKLIYAKGDSNEEYIFDGDVVGIDISDTTLMDGETYAMYFEGEGVIKQIFKESGGELVLHSRNPKYRDKRVNALNGESFRVMGRVRWRAG